MGIQVGILVDSEYGLTSRNWLDLARTCDNTGVDALFRSDHYLAPVREESAQSLDAWTSCAAAAAITKRVCVGTLMSPVTFRHPVVLAKTVLTVDQISHGRCEFGLGIGWNSVEHDAYGLPFPPSTTRYELLEEQLEILNLMWESTSTWSFKGKHYDLRDCPAAQRPISRPRIIVGKRARERSVGIAVRWADEYNTTFATVQEAAQIREKLNHACERAGRARPLRLSVMTDFVIGESRHDIAEQLREIALRFPWVDGADVLGQDAPVVVGSPDQVIEKLQGYAAAGVDRVILKHNDPTRFASIGLLDSAVLRLLGNARPA